MLEKDEKIVEYLELIYDLIFVYIIGRNNSLLHNLEGGFVNSTSFLAYILCSLAVIQIWTFSTYYINMFGRNGIRDHLALFLNMYLLYYIGDGTRIHWDSFQYRYYIAWALILINIGIQYVIEGRNHRSDTGEHKTCLRMSLVLFAESALVLVCIPLYFMTRIFFAGVPVIFGILFTSLSSDESKACLVDFPHLTERAMLYVVFTFGEMIIAIAPYFEGKISRSSLYFSIMSFLIVAGLFLSYEILYNRIIDRNKKSTGLQYMLIHIFLIFGMNTITTSLEFMRNEAVDLLPKTIMLVVSFLLYFICLFLLQLYARKEFRICRRIMVPVVLISSAFLILMFLFRTNMRINILVSVLYVYAVFFFIYRFSRNRGPCATEA